LDEAAVKLRKRVIGIEEIYHEGGPRSATPRLRGWCLAVIENPFAGRYVEVIEPFMEKLQPLGHEMATALVAAMTAQNKTSQIIDGYGKGAIIGEAGELEHAALWHAPGGYAMRALVADSLAIVPSTKKVGGPGTRLDVPITHVTASYVRSHFDAIEVGIDDSPRANEMLLVLAMTAGPRIHSRAGGLAASAITLRDGQK
jgi:hypothetical protein